MKSTRSNSIFNLFTLFALLASLLASAVTVTPARAAGIVVTTTVDSIDAGANCLLVTLASLPGPGGQTSLREAVCAANNNAGADTITFSVNGTFILTGAANEENGNSGDFDIKGSLSISGNGSANTILDGGGNERIFDVFPPATSTFGLSDLTLQNGDTRSTSFKEGGALYLHNNVTTNLTNVHIVNNFSGANGAIENRGILTITNGVLSGNQTIPASGNARGGAIHNTGTLTIDQTTIDNNSVRGEGGGIATNSGVATTVTITDSVISNNTASITGGGLGNGGGISMINNQGAVNISNTTISNNNADSHGGGMYNQSSNPSVSNSIFSSNSADFSGGGMYNDFASSPAISSSTFSGNGAFDHGGGIYIGGGSPVVSNSTFSGNGAVLDGGGIYIGGGSATVKNSTLSGNNASNSGGGMYVGGNTTLLNTIIANNINGGDCVIFSALNAASSNNLIENASSACGLTNGTNGNIIGSDPNLGGLTGSPAYFPLTPSSPAYNKGDNAVCAAAPVSNKDQRGVTRPQGDVCDIGAYEYQLNPQTGPTFTVTKADDANEICEVNDCSLREAIKAANATSGFDVIHFDGNYAITLTAALPTITEAVTIDGETHKVILDGASQFRILAYSADGGGYLDHLIFFNGAANPALAYGNSGGAIYSASVSGIDIRNSAFYNNSATAYGGAIFGEGTVLINNSAFSNNSAGSIGGGVSAVNATIINSTFSDNTAPFGAAVQDDGTVTLKNTILANSGGLDCAANGVSATSKNNLIQSTGSNACGLTNGVNGNKIGVDPLLGPLQDNGGMTPTMALLPGSPAVNAGHDATCAADPISNKDQRGVTRPQGALCDIGSFEFTEAVAPNTTLLTKPPVRTLNTSASFTFSGADNHSLPANLAFECKLDGEAFAPCVSPKTYNGLTAVKHTFSVRAKDEFGNVDSTPITYVWTVQKDRARNGGFNTYVNASKVPQFWVRNSAFSPIADGKDTTVKKEGIASVKIFGAAGKTKTLTQTLTLSGVAGDKFTFTFWAKGASIPAAGICRAQVLLYDGATLKLTKTVNCSTGTYAFQKKTLTFNAPSDYTQAIIRFTYGKANGMIWFDAVSLIR